MPTGTTTMMARIRSDGTLEFVDSGSPPPAKASAPPPQPQKEPEIGWTAWGDHPNAMSPVPDDTVVLVRQRSGETEEFQADQSEWANDPEDLTEEDIVSYRVVTDSEEDPGWIPWDPAKLTAGTGPTTHRGNCEVRFRSGGSITGKRDEFRWGLVKGETDYSDIVAWRPAISATGDPVQQDNELVGWRSTKNSVMPLPWGTKIQFLTRMGYEVGKTTGSFKDYFGVCDVEDLSWNNAGSPEPHDIRAYRVLGAVDEGWAPHDPRKDSKRPVGMGVQVQVKFRDGRTFIDHAHKFDWRHKLKDRDSEIVAWRRI
jgi:hypothetical protein